MMTKQITEIEVGKTYRHKRTGVGYTVTRLQKIKIDGMWVDGVGYVETEAFKVEYYARTSYDFKSKFEAL